MFGEEPVAAGSLFLVGASGLVLVPAQIVDGCRPFPVGAFRASASPTKNGPSGCPRRQQTGSLLVFAKGSLKPCFVVKRSTNVGRGVVAFVVVEQPLGGAWGRGCDPLNCSHQEASQEQQIDLAN